MADFAQTLAALIEKATPGPVVEDDGFLHSVPLCRKVDEWLAIRLERKEPNFERPETVVAQFSQDLPNFQADADIFAFLRNNASAILALVEQLKKLHMDDDPRLHGVNEALAALDAQGDSDGR